MPRPKVAPESSALANFLRALTVLIALAATVMLAVMYNKLPEQIPTHFGISGQPDSWGARATIWMMPVFFLPLIGFLLWLSFNPEVGNIPVRVTEQNAGQVYAKTSLLMCWILVFTAGIYAALVLTPVFGFNSAWVIGPCVAGMLGVTAWVLVSLRRLR